jgi:hypothetical protein
VRKVLMAILVVLLLAAAAGMAIKDDQGRPYLLAALHLGEIAPSLTGDDDGAITVYKWQDEEGNWHYADTPPPGSGAQPVQVGSPTVAPEPPAPGDEAAEKKGVFSHLPGVLQRAHDAGDKVGEASKSLEDRLDAASSP